MIIRSVRTTLIDLQAGGPITAELAAAGRALSPVPPMNPLPEHASVWTKANRLRAELNAWRLSGAKRVSREVRLERGRACEGDGVRPACGYWNAQGNLGLGECTYPGCGCTKGKRALATSVCPHKPTKWVR